MLPAKIPQRDNTSRDDTSPLIIKNDDTSPSIIKNDDTSPSIIKNDNTSPDDTSPEVLLFESRKSFRMVLLRARSKSVKNYSKLGHEYN